MSEQFVDLELCISKEIAAAYNPQAESSSAGLAMLFVNAIEHTTSLDGGLPVRPRIVSHEFFSGGKDEHDFYEIDMEVTADEATRLLFVAVNLDCENFSDFILDKCLPAYAALDEKQRHPARNKKSFASSETTVFHYN